MRDMTSVKICDTSYPKQWLFNRKSHMHIKVSLLSEFKSHINLSPNDNFSSNFSIYQAIINTRMRDMTSVKICDTSYPKKWLFNRKSHMHIKVSLLSEFKSHINLSPNDNFSSNFSIYRTHPKLHIYTLWYVNFM